MNACSTSACCPPRVIVTEPPPSPPAVLGETFADQSTDLQPTPSGEWTPVAGAAVTLPGPGTYEVIAEVRSRISNDAGGNGWIGARLFDATQGLALPNSERLIHQAVGVNSTRNLTGPIGAFVTVTQPTVVRVDAKRQGNSTAASIHSDVNGWTRLAYHKVADL